MPQRKKLSLGPQPSQILADLLITIAHCEQQIELKRQVLASNENFEPYGAFQRLDRKGSGYLAPREVLNFIRDNGVARGVTEADCYYLVKFFDSDMDGQLHYPDFMQVVLPCANAHLRAAASQRPNIYCGKFGYLTIDVEKELAELILDEIRLHRKTEELKQELESCKGFSKEACYQALDDCSMSAIFVKTLERFFRGQRRRTTEQDHLAIIRRIDLDADGKIKETEFYEAIHPQEPYSKLVIRQRLLKKAARQPICSIDDHKEKSRSKTPNRFSSTVTSEISLKMKAKQSNKMFNQKSINTRAMDQSLNEPISKVNPSPLKFRPELNMEGLQDEECYKREIYVYDKARLNTPERSRVSQYTPGKNKLRSASKSPHNLGQYPDTAVGKIAYSPSATQVQSRSSIRVQSPGAKRFGSPNLTPNQSQELKSILKSSKKYTTQRSQENLYQPTNIRSFANQKQPYTKTQNSPSPLDHEQFLRQINNQRDYDYDPMVPHTVTPADVGENIFRSHKSTSKSNLRTASPERKNCHDEHPFAKTLSTRVGTDYQYTKREQNYVSNDQQRAAPTPKTALTTDTLNDRVGAYHSQERANATGAHVSHQNQFSNLVQQQNSGYISAAQNLPIGDSKNKRLVQVFQQILEHERQVETLKVDLAMKSDFNLIDAFRQLDPQGIGQVEKYSLQNSLSELLGISTTTQQVANFMKRFDKDADEQLRYSEFCEAFLPADSYHASLLAQRTPQPGAFGQVSSDMSRSTFMLYKEVWEAHLANEMAIQRIRYENRGGMNMKQSFEACDTTRDNCICKEDLREFLAGFNIFVPDRDLCMLIERFDKSRDGTISYHEFMDELTPV